MFSDFHNSINLKIISIKPDLIVWYAKISKITQKVLKKKDYIPYMAQLKNKIFDKDNFNKCFLNHAEFNTINSFRAMKKQREWLSGRYLVKLMVHHNFCLNLPLEQINISYLDQGAPFLTHHPDIPLSLSHSNDYTASACCTNKTGVIGIDIEKIAAKPDAWFLKTAFTTKEITYLKDDRVSIFKNWTIKEAYLKYIKKGFNESLHNVEVIENKIWHNNQRVNVDIYSTIIDNNYILTLVSTTNS